MRGAGGHEAADLLGRRPDAVRVHESVRDVHLLTSAGTLGPCGASPSSPRPAATGRRPSGALAARLGVPFVELDALVHGPDWTETPDDELRQIVEPIVRCDGWVIDGNYLQKLGTLVLDAADTIVWLDLPIRVWLPRLIAPHARRVTGREALWNGNRETLADRVLAAASR